MAAAAARRLAAALALLALVLTGAFALLEAMPGDAAATYEDPRVPPEQRERLRAVYGLDRPAGERYLRFLGAAARFEWGWSFAQQRPVTAVLADALPWTLLLALAALALEFGLGLPLGLWAARRAGSAADHTVRGVSLAVWALPTFWLGLLLLFAFAYGWRLFPTGGVGSPGAAGWPLVARLLDALRHLALPAAAIGLPAAAATARFVRASLLDVAGERFLLAARARGLSPRAVVWRHALRTALSPVLQLFGLSLAGLLSGSLAVEVVFGWPGIGRTTYEALAARDHPVLLAGAALAAAMVVAGSLAAELLHLTLDPRVRQGRGD
jgi:peptide/nickel transport system permease protein